MLHFFSLKKRAGLLSNTLNSFMKITGGKDVGDMYAVVAHFDPETEFYIKTIWKELCEKSISKYVEEVPDRRPHITLADYTEIDEAFISTFEKYYRSKAKIQVVFSTLGTFINTGALLLTPTPSKELFELHNNHHKNFNTYSNPQSLYLPNQWIPHCTLANRLSPNKLAEAFNFCNSRMNTMHSEIVEVSIIKVVYHISVPAISKASLK